MTDRMTCGCEWVRDAPEYVAINRLLGDAGFAAAVLEPHDQ
jgi:hypothetical protein